ncbi:hypothetical protein F2Q68_00005748 [Brassica cretica]|uniref:SWIM-type domain-containing protein n=1 Tax=Brassica cretica TaxID=69181 RepID=A0A8S9JMK8_BRACR|nr:hypothetical protein F2Q68_00005748 [Brassica cretica]
MVCEDFGIDVNMVNIELSYLPSDLVIGIDSAPVFITNDRQLKNFLTYVKNKASTRLCVCIRSKAETSNIKVDLNLNEEATESSNRQEESMSFEVSEEDVEVDESDDDYNREKDMINGKSVRFFLVDVVKKGQHFTTKNALKATMEICAKKHNFDYKVGKSDKTVWYVRCTDDDCGWRVRAEGLTVRTASSKTVGSLIMHKYESVKEEPKPNDIIQFMRNDHGVEISYSLAWDAQADVSKWPRCQFPGYRYDVRTTNPAESINSALRSPREFPVIPLLDSIREMMTRWYDVRTTNPAESINSALRSPREFPVIPLLDSIREMMTRWFFKRRTLSFKHTQPLTIAVEKKINRMIEKGKKFQVSPISDDRFLVQGDTFECLVDMVRHTCSCGKFDLMKIPCRHAIKAAFSVGKKAHTLTDDMYTTASWRSVYEETINPITVPEDSWIVPSHVKQAKVLPPESRRGAGRRKKRR